MKRIVILLGTMLLTVVIVACGSTPAVQSSSEDTDMEQGETIVIDEPTPTPTEEPKQATVEVDEITLENYEEIIRVDVEDSISLITEKSNDVLESIGDSYDSYDGSKNNITEWYALVLSESNRLYETIISKTIECYKSVSNQIKDDNGFDWDEAMDDIYDVWDDAMDDYYEAWDELHDEIYDQWDDALDDDSVDYSKKSDAWSAAYEEHSTSWSSLYEVHSNAWSELYKYHSAVWSGFYSDNYDIDSIIKAEKENQDDDGVTQDEGSESDTMDEGIDNTEGELEKAPDTNTVFDPKDVSDATIESIVTYGDYLTMYKMIVDDYMVNYENAIKGTALYSEAAFQEMKNTMDESYEEQEEAYGAMKSMPIVDKKDLVDYLKEYRDTLKEYTDSLAETMSMMP